VGGNALKNTTTRRYDRDEYFELEFEVVAKLKAVFPRSRVEAVKAYRTKPSFGDMDVLVEVVDGDPLSGTNRYEVLEKTFTPNQMVKNGSVVSFDHKQFQVDVLFTPSDEFQTSVDYFAWNDLGNFVGRLSHKLGFKFGHDGLKFVMRDGTYQFKELVVSRDTRRTFEFLDLSYDRFQQGFDTMLDVFKFASSSSFFNKNMFAEENRNHRSNVRDKKRKSYHDFVVWMNETPGLPEYPWEDMKEQGGPKYKEQYMQRAFEFFPEFEVTYKEALVEYERVKEMRAKFNGDLVTEWTGFTEKKLGLLMQTVRQMFLTKEDFNAWVYDHSQDHLREVVMAKAKELDAKEQ
jgi:hypothetical protein